MGSQTENDLTYRNAPFRDRFCIARCGSRPTAGPAPHAPTPEDVETAFRNPILGWTANEVLFPVFIPLLAPKMKTPHVPV